MATTRQEFINSIDATYPVAGIDNNSQGFRDNFANIKTALTMTPVGGSGGTISPATPIVEGSVYALTTDGSTFLGHQAGLTASTNPDGYNNIAVGFKSSFNLAPKVGIAAVYSGGGVYGVYDSSFSGSMVISTFPTPIVNEGYRVVTTTGAATITSLNNPGIATYTGLSNAATTTNGGSNDDGYWTITLPFSVNYLGIAYSDIAVSTNGYITFGTDATQSGSMALPNYPTIAHANNDTSVQRIYHGTAGTGIYRIVIEATSGTGGILGSPNILTEYVFYQSVPAQIDVIGTLNALATIVTAASTATLGVSNIAIGAYALYSTTGTSAWSVGNIAIGEYSLYNAGPSTNNIAVGSQALFWNVTGSDNIAIGHQALFCNVTGSDNIAIGQCALYNNNCYGSNLGSNNIAVGKNAMLVMKDKENIAIGQCTLANSTRGCQNVMIGQCAGKNITYGNNNTIIGSYGGPSSGLNDAVVISAGACNRLKIDSGGICVNGAVLSSVPSLNSKRNFTIVQSGCTAPLFGNYGYDNVSIGQSSLYNNYGTSNYNGSNNTAFGICTLAWNCNGSSNIAVGNSALRCNINGTSNTALGANTLTLNGTGRCNIAFGSYAMYASCGGYGNIAIGDSALYNETNGNWNIGIGKDSLNNNREGAFNIALGYGSMNTSCRGSCNVALGLQALRSTLSASDNVAIGRGAMQYGGRSTNNVAIGSTALTVSQSGCNNVAVGALTGCSNTSGCNNTFLGYAAGNTNTCGCNNTMLGFSAVGAAAASINTITLGNASIATIRAQVTTITALSDCRDKTNIAGVPIGLDFLREIRPVQFEWNMRDGAKVGVPEMGFIAQELDALQQKYGVESALGLVLKDNPDRLEATPGKLLPVIIKAIQELATIVDQLAAK